MIPISKRECVCVCDISPCPIYNLYNQHMYYLYFKTKNVLNGSIYMTVRSASPNYKIRRISFECHGGTFVCCLGFAVDPKDESYLHGDIGQI